VYGYEVAKPNAHMQISGERAWVTGTVSEMHKQLCIVISK